MITRPSTQEDDTPMNTFEQHQSPAITASGITRSYGAIDAVVGVDLEVTRGETVALLGPNGAGKTTVVEILEGLRRRDSGVVDVLGHDPQHADASWRARIGAVLQLGTETDEFTVAELLTSHAAYYPNPRPVPEIVEALDLTGLEDRRVRRLSGGQRRRLDIALGIVGNPELLFLDEPTTGLDVEARHSIWQLIQALADGGTTIVLTTHYLDEVEHLADRTVVLVDGATVWTGKTSALRNTNAPTTIAFGLRQPLTIADLPGRLGVLATEVGPGRVTIDSGDVNRIVADLLQWAASRDGADPVTNLQIGQPTLEDAYLALLDTTHGTTHGKREHRQ